MMVFKKIILAFLILWCQFGYSQNSDRNFEYKINRNDPGESNSISLGYSIGASGDCQGVKMEGWNINYNGSKYSAGINMQFVPIIFGYDGKFDYSKSIRRNPDYDKVKPIYRKTELFFNYFLLKKETNDRVKKNLGSAGIDKTYVASVPVNGLRVSGIRPGIAIHQGLLDNNSAVSPFYDEFTHASVFIGLFSDKYKDFDVSIDGKSRERINCWSTYVDIFLSPSGKIKDTPLYSSQYTYKPFGIRFGTHFYSQKKLGMNFKFEIGTMPGASLNKGDRFYILVGFGPNFTKKFN